MEKDIKDLITIHLVADGIHGSRSEEDSFYGSMCDAHTHGMNEFGHRELQLVLLFKPKAIGYIINRIAKEILDGKIEPKDKLMIPGVFEDCNVRLDEAKDEEGNLLWRIIIPDDDGKFPEDTTDKTIARQLYSPYIEII